MPHTEILVRRWKWQYLIPNVSFRVLRNSQYTFSPYVGNIFTGEHAGL